MKKRLSWLSYACGLSKVLLRIWIVAAPLSIFICLRLPRQKLLSILIMNIILIGSLLLPAYSECRYRQLITEPMQTCSSLDWKTMRKLCKRFGLFGVHRYYAGFTLTAVLYTLSLGGLGALWLVDWHLIKTGCFTDSKGGFVVTDEQNEYYRKCAEQAAKSRWYASSKAGETTPPPGTKKTTNDYFDTSDWDAFRPKEPSVSAPGDIKGKANTKASKQKTSEKSKQSHKEASTQTPETKTEPRKPKPAQNEKLEESPQTSSPKPAPAPSEPPQAIREDQPIAVTEKSPTSEKEPVMEEPVEKPVKAPEPATAAKEPKSEPAQAAREEPPITVAQEPPTEAKEVIPEETAGKPQKAPEPAPAPVPETTGIPHPVTQKPNPERPGRQVTQTRTDAPPEEDEARWAALESQAKREVDAEINIYKKDLLSLHISSMPNIYDESSTEEKAIRQDSKHACFEHNTKSQISEMNKLLKEMHQLSDTDGEEVPIQKSKTNAISYLTMSKKQKAWYLYWRAQYRQGTIESFDPGYAVFYMREICYGFGWTEPADGLAMLTKLYEDFRSKEPSLLPLFHNWITDFCFLYGTEFSITEEFYPNDFGKQLYLFHNLSQEHPLRLPFRMLCDISLYNVSEQSFFLNHKEYQKIIPEIAEKALAVIDNYHFKKEGRGVIEKFEIPYTQEEFTFFSSPENRIPSYAAMMIELPNYREAEQLQVYITSLLQAIENKTRRYMKLSGKLKLIAELDPADDLLLDKFLQKYFDPNRGKKPERRVISIKAEALSALIEETAESSQIVAASELEDETTVFDFAPIVAAAPVNPPAKNESKECTFFVVEMLPEDYQALLTSLSETEEEAISYFVGDGDAEAALDELAKRINTFPDMILDQINEIAESCIGDILFDNGELLEEHMEILATAKKEGA